MSKHTKGPWEIHGNGVFPKGKSSNIATASIMSLDLNLDGTLRPCEEMQANVNLITAAPDLLEACKFALEQFMNIEQSELFDSFVIQQLSDAIQKAEGGDQ